MNITDILAGTVLVGIRIGGLFVFAPVFSSAAIPVKVKAILVSVLALTLGPSLAARSLVHLDLGVLSLARETAISLWFGLTLSLILELANFAGQIAGMQFSFTLVNLLDPNSNIETSLFSQVFQLLTTTLLVSAGFDRLILEAMLRTYSAVPLGSSGLDSSRALSLLPQVGGIILAAFELVAPLVAATILIEVSIALLSRLSPQLPVLALTIPAKTIVGYVVLFCSLATWSVFIENHFAALLDLAEASVAHAFRG